MGGSAISTDLSSRIINISGGEESNVLNVSEIPAHKHKMDIVLNPTNEQWTGWNFPVWGVLGSNQSAEKIVMQNAGSNTPHNNMPPYYVLTYIMKIL